jgi:murein DD-endopeptidase MepM/ murein hydrolase activator NlpD
LQGCNPFRDITLKKTFTNWLVTRYQVVIRNEDNLAEKTTFSFSYAKLMVASFFALLFFLSLGLLLSHTILRKWLNPAYIEQENRNKLMHLYMSLENLEKKNAQQDKFIKMFQSTLEEKGEPSYALENMPVETLTDTGSPLEEHDLLAEGDLHTNDIVSMKHKGLAGLREQEAQTTHAVSNPLDGFLFVPIEGIITTPFNPQIEHYGLDIVGKEHAPIKCIADGRVVLSTWTVETGWVIVVQHNKNLLSVYKHNATLFKKTSDLVKGGEVIAIMGNSGEFTTGPHLHFELWYDGNPVNPEELISF